MVGQLEIEAKFIICATDVEEIFEKIAGLKQIGSLGFSAPHPHDIFDYYVDSSKNDLIKAGFALRIREIDNTLLVTLKGQSKIAEDGSIQRLEIENNWDEKGWFEIADYLNQHVESFRIDSAFDQSLNPLQFLKSRGLGEIQRRKNWRQVKNIYPVDNPQQIIAEFALDTTLFSVQGALIKQFEIEVEIKSERAVNIVRLLSGWFKDHFGSKIRTWQHNKLATGLAIEYLWDFQEFRTSLDDEQCLLPESYQMIENYFNNHEIQSIH